MLASLLLALTISAPDDFAGARVAIDGRYAGALRDTHDGYARLVVKAGFGAHSATIDMPHFVPVTRRFHFRPDVPLDVRVLRREIVRTGDERWCVCHDEPNIDAIFSGRVIGVGRITEADVPIHVITFEATKWWQSDHQHHIVEVRTWDAGSRYCGVSFVMGREYFVRAWGTSALHTDACARTRPLEKAKSEIARLEREMRDAPEPAAHLVEASEQDLNVLAAIDCSHARPRWLARIRTSLAFALDPYESPEESREELENDGEYELAAIAPELVTRLIEINAKDSAIVRSDRDVSYSLPAYLGDYAVVLTAVSGFPTDTCPGLVYLRRTAHGWRVVARTYW